MNPNHHYTWKFAREILRANNMTISQNRGEYRVNFEGGTEDTAYYTNDLQDAIDTGKAMRNNLNSVQRRA
jgi:hypothetical protein